MINRRHFIASLGACASSAVAYNARAFGEDSAFEPVMLLAGGLSVTRPSAAAQWSAEVDRRTSAPTKRSPRTVRLTDKALLDGPFAVWAGNAAPKSLSRAELSGLRTFLNLGGLLLVDDANAESGAFTRGAKREIARVLPDLSPIKLLPDHVLFRTFYLLKPGRPFGRVQHSTTMEAIVRSGFARVLFSTNDLCGALARNALGTWDFSVEPDGDEQREKAIRFAVNIAMYALTTNYKDDAVHTEFIMKKRSTIP